MSKINADRFEIIEEGTSYMLPEYTVTPQGLQPTVAWMPVTFVRGSKNAQEKIKPVDGILHEALLAMQIHDLKHKNKLVPSRETALAITKLEDALLYLQSRQQRREKEGTQGTYQK